MFAILTVTAREGELTELAKSLGRQKVQRPVQWIVVDSHFPVKRNHLLELHRTHLAHWQISYAAPAASWAAEHGYRSLAAMRNDSILLAGINGKVKDVLCCALDDDLIIEGSRYLETLWSDAKRKVLLVPPITYDGAPAPRKHVSGNAATPFWLTDFLEVNGYDELLDANWPGTSTYEDVDLLFRLKALGELTLKPGGPEVALRHTRSQPLPLKGLKCNHILRASGSPVEQGGGGMNWDTNDGPPGAWVGKVLEKCPWLARDRCAFLGRACEVALDVARWGHEDLAAFLASRPKRDLAAEWQRAGQRRRQAVIGHPLSIELY